MVMTELTPQLIADELTAGRRVLYVADDQEQVRYVLDAVRELLPARDITKVTRSRYEQSIECVTGGRLLFAAATDTTGRGMQVDTLVLDTWKPAIRAAVLPALMGSASPRLFDQRRELVEVAL